MGHARCHGRQKNVMAATVSDAKKRWCASRLAESVAAHGMAGSMASSDITAVRLRRFSQKTKLYARMVRSDDTWAANRVARSPLDHGAGPGQAAAEDDEQNLVARPDASGAVGLVERDGHGGGPGVAVTFEVEEEAVGRIRSAGRQWRR